MAKRMKEENTKKRSIFNVLNLQSGDMVIDFGTKNTVILVKDKGVVMHEESCAAQARLFVQAAKLTKWQVKQVRT